MKTIAVILTVIALSIGSYFHMSEIYKMKGLISLDRVSVSAPGEGKGK